MHVNPVIQAVNHLPIVAPDVPVERRPVAPERSQTESQDRRQDRDFAATSQPRHVAADRIGQRGDGAPSRAIVKADLRLQGVERRAAPLGPSLTYLAQSLAQEVVPEHKYQPANARGAGVRAYEAANDRMATILGPDYPFDRRV